MLVKVHALFQPSYNRTYKLGNIVYHHFGGEHDREQVYRTVFAHMMFVPVDLVYIGLTHAQPGNKLIAECFR